MKRFYLYISLLLIPGNILLAASPDTAFFRANSLYQEGKYEDAIDAYNSVIKSGFESPGLYYNLANAYFRSNKLGKSRLYYEKALKINPSDEDAQANLSYLESLLADKFEEVPVIFYKKWIKSFMLSFNSNQWALFSMISFILSAVSVVIYLLFSNITLRKTGFFAALLFFVLSVLSFAFSRNQYHLNHNPDSAVVTDLSVNAKSAPRETGTGLFVLHEGAKVWLEDEAGGWQEIRLSDGRKGWVPVSSIEPI